MEKIYLDTSVFGGYFEKEFEKWTKVLFEKIYAEKFFVLYSELTEQELAGAPKNVIQLANTIPDKQLQFVKITPEAFHLADKYIEEKVVGNTSRSDCIHIALATLNNADVLISWNFKHIVNVNRIRGYNAVNYRLGYKMLEIRTPIEIIE